MVDTGENVTNVELVYAGQEVEVTETSASLLQPAPESLVTLDKVLEQDETFGIGMNGEISAVTFGSMPGGHHRSRRFRDPGRRASGDRFCE